MAARVPEGFTFNEAPEKPIQLAPAATEVTQCKNRGQMAAYLGMEEATKDDLRSVYLLPPVVLIYNKWTAGKAALQPKTPNSPTESTSAKVYLTDIFEALRRLMQVDQDEHTPIEDAVGLDFADAIHRFSAWTYKDNYITGFLYHAGALLSRYCRYRDLVRRQESDEALDAADLKQLQKYNVEFNEPGIYTTMSRNHQNQKIPEALRYVHDDLPRGLQDSSHVDGTESKFERYNRIWQLVHMIKPDCNLSKWERFFKKSEDPDKAKVLRYSEEARPKWWTKPAESLDDMPPEILAKHDDDEDEDADMANADDKHGKDDEDTDTDDEDTAMDDEDTDADTDDEEDDDDEDEEDDPDKPMESDVVAHTGGNQSTIKFDVAPIQVIVGVEKKKRFYVHPSILAAGSEFFKSALDDWNRDENRPIEVPEADTDSFNAYLQWLYAGKITTEPNETQNLDDVYFNLARLYVLGEKLMDTTFQDSLITAMVSRFRRPDTNGKFWYPDNNAINLIYSKTPIASPTRRFLVDLYVRYGQRHWPLQNQEDEEDLNHEFLKELTVALLERRVLPPEDEKKYEQLDKGTPCEYHQHNKTKPCEKD